VLNSVFVAGAAASVQSRLIVRRPGEMYVGPRTIAASDSQTRPRWRHSHRGVRRYLPSRRRGPRRRQSPAARADDAAARSAPPPRQSTPERRARRAMRGSAHAATVCASPHYLHTHAVHPRAVYKS
jgi:hypothetical protein